MYQINIRKKNIPSIQMDICVFEHAHSFSCQCINLHLDADTDLCTPGLVLFSTLVGN